MPDFDPYYQWLAIPPKHQPPNHYRLLGVELFESNADAIESAADQRMAHVRSFQTGKYSLLSQRLLNEISVAKICLLSPERRATYDRDLRRQLSSQNKTLWLGLAAFIGAAITLATILVVKSFKPNDEVASAEHKRSAGAESAGEPKPINPNSQAALAERMRRGEPLPNAVPHEPEGAKPPAAADSAKSGQAVPTKPAELTIAIDTPPHAPAGGDHKDSVAETKSPTEKPTAKPQATPAEKPAEKPLAKPAEKPAAKPIEKPLAKPIANPPTQAMEKTAGRLAPPNEAAQKQILTPIRETYKSLNRAADKLALAEKLLEQAEERRGDSNARFALLREAKDLAAETGQGELAFEIVDCLAAEYRIAAAAMKTEIIEKATGKIRSAQQRQTIALAALAVIDEALTEDDFTSARQLSKLVLAMARAGKDRGRIQEITAISKDVESAAKASADAAEALAALKKNPADPAANLLAGKHLCLVKGDWEQGLPLLARGGDARLKALAEQDLKGPETAAEQLALGDAWSEARGPQRAAAWHEKAVPSLKSPDKDRVVEQVFSQPLGKRTVNLLAWADPPGDDSDGKWGKWTRTGSDLVCLALPPLTDGRQEDWATVALPVEVSGQYDLLVSFTRNKVGSPARDEILIDFPVGGHNCGFAIGESGCGLGNIDGKNCYHNETTTLKAKLVDGRRSALLLKVRRVGNSATIDVLLDNQALIHWHGEESSLSSTSPYIKPIPPLEQRFFLSTRSMATFHAAELRIISGKSHWVRPQ